MLSRLVRHYMRPYRRLLTLVVVFQAAQTLATLTLPSLNADIIDKGIARNDQDYIWRIGAVMLVASVAQVVFSVFAVRFGAQAGMAFGRDVRQALFHRVTSYSAREVNRFGPPSLITRITNDVQQVQMLVVMGATMFVSAPIMMVGGVLMALREDVGLSSMLVVCVPLLGLATADVVRRLVPRFRTMQERLDELNRILREQIVGIRVVRAFVREPDEVRRFARANDDLTATALGAGRLMARLFPTVMLVLNVSMVGAVWIGAERINDGQMRLGALVAFLSYLTQILMSVMMATFVFIMVPRAAVCAERIHEVLDTPTSVVPPSAPVHETPERGSLEFRNVEFRYPGAEEPVLRDISFTARAGETVAIIGSTGSGKTTLLQLIPRLFDATAGEVRIDGVDVRTLAPEVLWQRIGLVPQRPYLFSGTVASNLRFGDPDADEKDLWDVLRVAQADSFVASMPNGLDSIINQGGTNVSGGQRQRLAIARALVHKPDIFLFDDSFSALDLATDARLRGALAPRTTTSIVVVVAQRVSTIAQADRILVLEDGELVGVGTHTELLQSCPTYIEIVTSQLTESEVDAA